MILLFINGFYSTKVLLILCFDLWSYSHAMIELTIRTQGNTNAQGIPAPRHHASFTRLACTVLPRPRLVASITPALAAARGGVQAPHRAAHAVRLSTGEGERLRQRVTRGPTSLVKIIRRIFNLIPGVILMSHWRVGQVRGAFRSVRKYLTKYEAIWGIRWFLMPIMASAGIRAVRSGIYVKRNFVVALAGCDNFVVAYI